MPNTLAHLGINGIVTRTIIKKADLLLIYFGAIIPDVPWIIQRFANALLPEINPYDVRLYCIMLASLFFSIILSAALAYLFIDTRRTFVIFGIGSFLHLFLDSLEIKWANGVHLFAPFSWKLLNIGLFWPESIPIYSLSAFGFFYLIFNWKESISSSIDISFSNSKKILTALILIMIYLSLPFLFFNDVEAANNHYVKTLREKENRIGKYFEVDRGFYSNLPNGDEYVTSFNEHLKVVNLNLKKSENMSIRAKFTAKDEIQILDYHIHGDRDIFTYIGLGIVLILLIISTLKEFKYKRKLF